jgi:general secretion pathway protein D
MKTFKILCLISLLSVVISFSPSLSFSEDKRPSGNIAFNFIDVEIPTVIKFISEITGINFIFDERIKGKITIIAPAKLSIDDSFSLFTSVLNLKGYTIIQSGPKTYKIIPSSQAKKKEGSQQTRKYPSMKHILQNLYLPSI